MKSNLFKKIIGNKITGIIVTVLSVVVILGAIFSVSNLSIAADSLPGIVNTRNDITDPNNPYKVLEIVPDTRSAEFGFLIGGEEPLINNAYGNVPQDVLYNVTTGNWMSVEEYFATNVDTMDASARAAFISQLVADNPNYINEGAASTDKPLWYEPYTEEYNGAPVDANTPGAQVIYGGNTAEYGYLKMNDNSAVQVGWNAAFKKITFEATYEDILAKSTPYYMVDTSAESVRVLRQEDFMSEVEEENAFPDYYYVYEKISAETERDTYALYGTVEQLREACLENSNLLVDVNAENGKFFILRFKLFTENDYTSTAGPVLYEASEFKYVTYGAPYDVEPMQAGTKGHSLVKPSNNIYYLGGIHSNEWFKRYSLDIDADKTGNYYVDVVSVTPAMLNAQGDNLQAYIDDFDFIYINHGVSKSNFNYSANNNDLTVDGVKYIFEKVCNDKIPCIVDYTLVATAGVSNDNTNTVIYALACMLMQDDYRAILTDGVFDTGKLAVNAGYINQWYRDIVNTNGNNYVNGNVMVVNTAGVKLLSNYCEAPYNSTADAIIAAYGDIYDEIALENLYRAADTEASYEPLSSNVFKATVVRYIMNYKDTRQESKKIVINVLEIQPALVQYQDSSNSTGGTDELSPSIVRQWAGADSSVTVNITTMTTNEFVGKIEDMNSEYDLIYIGADIYSLPKVWDNNWNSNRTDYVDTTMNGMIYTNVGDIKSVDSRFAGQLDTDFVDATTRNVVHKYNNARFSGNDISADKYNKLVDYLKGAYPIVVSNTLCNKTSAGQYVPSSKTLDNCTYLYSLLEQHLDDKNMFTVEEVSTGKNINFKFYVNRGKLSIGTSVLGSEESSVTNGTAFVVPGTLLSGNDTTDGRVTYISRENGKFYLTYKFTITNDGAVYGNTKYTAALYLDSNSDGKFSVEYEKIPDITVTHAASGEKITNGELIAGEQYILTRQVPETYSGVLTWKVEVQQTNNEYIRDNEIGYTRLNDPEREAVTIKVLHVHKDSGDYLNLEEAIGNTSTSGNHSILKTLVWGGTYQNVKYDGITKDFKFEFTSISNKEFNKSYENNKLWEYNSSGTMVDTGVPFNLMDYDMFVLGFYDSYTTVGGNNKNIYHDISEDAINGENGIKEYIDSGKSILFAHDTTSFAAVKDNTTVTVEGTSSYIYTGSYNCNAWAYTLNKNIRDMVGLDAYGVSLKEKGNIDYSLLSSGRYLSIDNEEDAVLMNALKNDLDEDGHYTIGLKKLAYKPGSSKTATVGELQGLTYPWAEQWPRYSDGNTQKYHYRYQTSSNRTQAYKNVSNATKVNEGQITTYPYYLNDTITTASTHAQYFTLDLNADDDGDNETDLVVWFALGGHTVYNMSPNDVVNNYYIYNKGNITYTGIGHSHRTTTIEEGKLFINTLVAAYNASTKEPEVFVYESEENMTPVSAFYEYGDVENEVAFRQNSQRMYFSINDTNVIRGTKSAHAEYYVALKAGTVAADATSYTDSTGKSYSVYTDNKGVKYIKLTDLKTYTAAGAEVDATKLDCGTLYYVDIPISVFDISGVDGQNVNTFMVAGRTTLEKIGALTGKVTVVETSTTYNKVEFIHVELFPLD